jgi:hypothetical protein
VVGESERGFRVGEREGRNGRRGIKGGRDGEERRKGNGEDLA